MSIAAWLSRRCRRWRPGEKGRHPASTGRPFGDRSRLALIAALLLLSTRPAAAGQTEPVEIVIPGGQEYLLTEMFGGGATPANGCRFEGADYDGARVIGEYICNAVPVLIELRHHEDASAQALRTHKFAIVVRSGSAPTALLDALAASVRSRESSFEWKLIPKPPSLPLTSVAVACSIMLMGLVVQAVLAYRLRPGRAAHRRRDVSVPRRADDTAAAGKRHFVLAMGLVAAYLATRLTGMTRLPVVIDEAIHIVWARAAWGQYLLPELLVGKWLPIQIIGLCMWLPFEPLACARSATVLMGLATLLACVLINRELFSMTEGLLAGAIYTLLPFALLYDRLALADPYVTAFAAWTAFFSIRMIRVDAPIAPVAMCLTAYAAILSKPTGALFIVTPLLASVLLVKSGCRIAYLKRALPAVISCIALVICLLYAGYGTGLLAGQSKISPDGQLDLLLTNVALARDWLTALLTPTLALCALVAALWGTLVLFRGARQEAFLVALLGLCVLPYLLVSEIWYPQYIHFIVVPISLLLGRAILRLAGAASTLAARQAPRLRAPVKAWVSAGALFLLAIACTPMDLALLREPENAPLPDVESRRYVRDGLSGYGLPELARYLRAQASGGALNVVRFDLVGPAYQGLDTYLSPSESIRLHAISPDGGAAVRIASMVRARRTLFVSNPEQERSLGLATPGDLGRAHRVWRYSRPGLQTTLEVWEVGGP